MTTFGTVLSGWRARGAFQAPSAFQSGTDQGAVQTVFRTIYRRWQRTVRRVNQMDRAFVPRLFNAGRPAAVGGGIRTLVIHSVDRVIALWPRSHIGKEPREIIEPFRTDGDPSSAVVFIGWICGIRAALNQALPRLVFPRVVQAVSEHLIPRDFPLPTAATERVLATQIMRGDDVFITAITPTAPIDTIRAWSGCSGHNQQASHAFADPVGHFHNRILPRN